MKKLSFIFLFFISLTAFSQIERIDQQKVEITSRISNAYMEKVDDKEYNFFYKDMNSVGHEYVSFSFKTLNNSYDLLYEIFMEGFNEPPRDPVKFKANGEIVWLKYFKKDGIIFLQIEQNLERANESDEYDADSSNMTRSRELSQEDITNLFKKF